MTDQMTATMQEEFLERPGGGRLFLRSWHPASAPRGVVVICHGLNAHSGQYAWPAEQMAAAGYAVYAGDLRGRGKSDGARFYVEELGDWVADVALVVRTAKAREPGLKVVLLGHSAGGVVACLYAIDHQAEISGLVCESFAFRVPAPGFALSAIKGLAKIAPTLGVLKLKMRDFSRDPEVVRRLEADPLTLNETQPAATIAALVRGTERLEAEMGRITLPLLILHGTADKATRPAGSEIFAREAGSPDKDLKLYEGHVHDLLADTGREAVL